MQKLVTYTEEEWNELPQAIIEAIQKVSAKGYGVKFIDRETGEESDPMSIFGLFVTPVTDALKGKRSS